MPCCGVGGLPIRICSGKQEPSILRIARARNRRTYNPLAPLKETGGKVARPRAADDFAAVRTRMDELRLERDQALAGQI